MPEQTVNASGTALLGKAVEVHRDELQTFIAARADHCILKPAVTIGESDAGTYEKSGATGKRSLIRGLTILGGYRRLCGTKDWR
jgi:hypothetical protein